MTKPKFPQMPPRPRAEKAAAKAERRWPWMLRADLEPADIFALQALEKGIASADQQQRGLRAVLRLTEHERMSFYPGSHEGDRATTFAEGKRWVGLQLVRFLRMRPDVRPGEPVATTRSDP